MGEDLSAHRTAVRPVHSVGLVVLVVAELAGRVREAIGAGRVGAAVRREGEGDRARSRVTIRGDPDLDLGRGGEVEIDRVVDPVGGVGIRVEIHTSIGPERSAAGRQVEAPVHVDALHGDGGVGRAREGELDAVDARGHAGRVVLEPKPKHDLGLLRPARGFGGQRQIDGGARLEGLHVDGDRRRKPGQTGDSKVVVGLGQSLGVAAAQGEERHG